MKIKRGGDFELCPEYSGGAVCVDVTEPKEVETQYGKKLKFRFAFEIQEKMADGKPFVIWSSGFALTYSDRSALKKFLDKWLKRELTDAELENIEFLIGHSAQVSITHDKSKDGEKEFANIALIQPWKGEPIRPSGLFVRQKDREQKDGQGSAKSSPSGSGRNDYQSFRGEPAKPTWQAYKIEMEGNLKGIALGDLPKEKLDAVINKWLLPLGEKIKGGYNCKAWENRMVTALNAYIASTESMEPDQSVEDEIPMDF